MIKSLWNSVDGWKTFAGILVLFLALGLQHFGFIDANQYQSLWDVGMAVSGVGALHKIVKAVQ